MFLISLSYNLKILSKKFIILFKSSTFMDLLSFIITVIILSASGALAPGPLFFVTINQGIRSGTRSGLVFSLAHTLIEFSLVMLLALGLLSVANEPSVRFVVGFAGGISLLIFGIMQIRNLFHKINESSFESKSSQNLFFMGLILTGLNPYFIIWWFTIGANLIFLSLEFLGLFGVIFMYFCHVWIDYVWLTLLAGFAKKSDRILKGKWYRLINGIFGLVLIYFGLFFLVDTMLI